MIVSLCVLIVVIIIIIIIIPSLETIPENFLQELSKIRRISLRVISSRTEIRIPRLRNATLVIITNAVMNLSSPTVTEIFLYLNLLRSGC